MKKHCWAVSCPGAEEKEKKNPHVHKKALEITQVEDGEETQQEALNHKETTVQLRGNTQIGNTLKAVRRQVS